MTVIVDSDYFYCITEVLARINDEVQRQEQEWGVQAHPVLGGMTSMRPYYAAEEQRWQRVNASDAEAGTSGWDAILLEEVFEALVEDDPGLAVTELIQVAAVCVSMIRSIQRHGLEGSVAA